MRRGSSCEAGGSTFGTEEYEVQIFSSCFTKGSSDTASREDTIGGVRITRFPARKLGEKAIYHGILKRKRRYSSLM